MITRIQGNAPPGRAQSTTYRDLVWTVATADDDSLDLTRQTTQALHNLETQLTVLGSSKSWILSAHVFIANIDDKPVMDSVWNHWIGDNPDHWPQRVCLGVELGGGWLIEITVTAAKNL